MASYENISYALRPAKSVERKMLCEAFRHLRPLRALSAYRYVGFGSTYFSDFILMHKTLGMSNLISIEKDEENKDRFELNKPYKCIKMEYGQSGDVLAKLKWNIPTIIWLDYDDKLLADMLEDIKYVSANAAPGSVLLVSVNVTPASNQEGSTLTLDRLKAEVGDERLSAQLEEKDLKAWGLAAECRKILVNEIVATLAQRNGAQPEEARLSFKQLFNFQYADGAKMLTVGGLIVDKGQEEIVAGCGFGHMEFIRDGVEPYLISVPKLTPREVRALDILLPDAAHLKMSGIPDADVKAYQKVYRYYPHFVETEF